MSVNADRACDPSVDRIDAVFLTSNSRDQALECIAHLREPEIASIVVVDNASTDGTADAIRSAAPDVTLIALAAPTGLAAAMNQGARLGRAPFVLYLNDDVFAAPGAIRLLLDALQERGDAVAAGGRLVESDLTTQDEYRPRDFPSPATVVARLVGLERLWPRNPWTGTHLRRMLDDHTTVEVDQPAGACLLVRRAVTERIGGWDERYWFWYEDVDFSRRLASHGSQIYVPTAAFRHVGGSTARRLRRVDGHQRNYHGLLVYARVHFAPPGRALVALTLAVVGAVRSLQSAPSDRSGARIYAATVRASAGLLLGRPAVGLRKAGSAEPGRRRVGGPGAPCPVCCSPSAVTDRFRPTLLRVCSSCGLFFRADGCDEGTVRGMYGDDSYFAERTAALTSRRSHDARLRATWVRSRVPGRRLLDLGTGAGGFLVEAGGQGFQAIGVEPSGLAAGYARSRLGVDVRTGFLDTADLPERDFDAVCMWHVLEHVPDPLALLHSVHQRLHTGGRLVLEVPNIDSVGACIRRGRWAHLDPIAHVCHFAPRSLKVALEATGFEVVELETLVESYYDELSMKLRPRRAVGRVVRALRLRSPAQMHPTRGELLRVIAAPVR